MKTFLFLLITGVGSLLLSVPVFAEMLTGEVLSVDKDKQQLVLRIFPGKEKQQKIIIQTTKPLPASAHAGTSLLIWGKFESEENVFTATDFRGLKRWSGHDPTGVRSRLHRSPSSRIQNRNHRPRLRRMKSMHRSHRR